MVTREEADNNSETRREKHEVPIKEVIMQMSHCQSMLYYRERGGDSGVVWGACRTGRRPFSSFLLPSFTCFPSFFLFRLPSLPRQPFQPTSLSCKPLCHAIQSHGFPASPMSFPPVFFHPEVPSRMEWSPRSHPGMVIVESFWSESSPVRRVKSVRHACIRQHATPASHANACFHTQKHDWRE